MDFNFQEEIILEDERVLIRPMRNEDKEHLMELLLVPDLSTYSSLKIKRAKDTLLYIDQCLDDYRAKIRYPFTFYDKKNKIYAGTSCFGNISNQHKRIEIGWTKIAKPLQGTGLNAHCKFLMLRYAFEHLLFNRVELKSHSENIRSRKAMEKIGAKYEGMLRHHMIMPDGTIRDTVYYSILLEEWSTVKALLKSLMQKPEY